MSGAGGMLGLAFYEEFKNQYELRASDIDLNEDWLHGLDFRDYDLYLKEVNDFSPHWLFHLGAYTDLEYCELNSEDTYLTNTESVKHATKISNDLGIAESASSFLI